MSFPKEEMVCYGSYGSYGTFADQSHAEFMYSDLNKEIVEKNKCNTR